jgi:hypothetical protein
MSANLAPVKTNSLDSLSTPFPLLVLKLLIITTIFCLFLTSCSSGPSSSDSQAEQGNDRQPASKQAGESDDQRLNQLLNETLVNRVGNPEALNIKLNPVEKYDEELLTDKSDREFLEKHRDKAIDILLPQLKDTGSQSAALLLGYFKEPKALPHLKHWFVHSGNFYGWETSFPDELNYSMFTHQHCYEEAIKHITGKELNEAITLTEEDVNFLVERYRQDKEGTEAALYVLYRLKPETAASEFSRRFLDSPKDERFKPCLTLKGYFLKIGMSPEVTRQMAGEPDKINGQVWTYDCGNGWVNPESRYTLTVTFENDKVAALDFSENETGENKAN